MKTYRHIFFDLDRTLWDFEKNSAETLLSIHEEFSLGEQIPDQDLFIVKYNYFNDHLWDEFKAGTIKKAELRVRRFELLLAYFDIRDEELVSKISRFYLNTNPLKKELIPGAKETLEYLHGKYELYVISNGFYDVQLTKLISSGISKYIRKTFTSDRIGIAKPKPGIYNYALSSVNARKAESVMVGDDAVNDVHGAHYAKIDQVYFNRNGIPSRIPPTWEITNLLQLKEIF
ncbi:MAG: YjjG family noncanonical pyrimidine nucleotidase [Bacteroidales bacterium]|nr:YjjG family noncanonical pyrimidine nucleotidase [Bacteroidales bacterium]